MSDAIQPEPGPSTDLDENRTPTPPPERRRSSATAHRASSHHGRRHGDPGRVRLLQITSGLLAAALMVTLIGWIYTWVRLHGEKNDNHRLAVALRNQGQELDGTRAELARIRDDLRALVEKRIPNVRPLQFDSMIPVNMKYLRTISFTRTGVGEAVRYEYQLLVECLDKDPIIPKARILLFDEVGLQVGAAEVAHKDSTAQFAVEYLAPGERRAYTAAIPLSRKVTPAFFQVSLE